MPVNLPLQNEPANQPGKTAENTSPQNSAKNIMGAINGFLAKFSSIPISEKLFFVQHLSIMLKAGISLSVALKTLGKQTSNKRFASIINDVSKNVEKGVSFTASLKPHEKIFGQLFVSMIESGEISGKLEEVLKRLYIQFKKNHELVSKVKGALTYPAVILVAMTGIGIFMMIVVVPKITAMFKDFNAELPLVTKLLIKFSDSLVAYGLLYLIGAVIFIITLVQLGKTSRGKYIFHGLLLKLPIFSPIIKKINLARFARTISSLLKTDIMIIKSFQITANVLGNVYYRDALNEMSNKIKKGGTINEVISNYPNLFTPVVTQMIAVGEETGELDYILEELAEFYEGEIDQIMNNLPAIIEPVLILLLGLVVGGMAVAVIMPMYSLTSAI
ncbi:MAG: type II secretion system F family protein [Candidatus Falkowbacteria bacterium]